MKRALLALALVVSPVSARAETELERGLAGAVRGCEEWVLNPESWADGVAPFVAKVGLGDKMGLVDRVEEATLPPPELRRGNHYWRINSTTGAGYVLVVSDQLPMCHITGGGDTDLQPVVEAVIASPEFTSRWQRTADRSNGTMTSTEFQNRQAPALTIVVSRAKGPGDRLDRVQLLATAVYEISN